MKKSNLKTIKFLLIVFCIIPWAARVYGGKSPVLPEQSRIPAIISCLRIDQPLFFCGEKVPLDDFNIRERLEKELMLSLWNRPQVILWLKRSRRSLPIIEKMLRRDNMPPDLKYVAVIESALRPHVGSTRGAIGFWQFMSATGRKYGLTINNEKDERRNIFTSTAAAISYFKKLRALFGSWTLAAAAYNMGEDGLQSEIATQETNNYYQLYLPLETQRYLFRIIAAKLIFADPAKYGFELEERDYYPPRQFDRITLPVSQKIPISLVARAARTSFKEIKDLNPEIRGHYIAEGRHTIAIPIGSGKDFLARYQKLLKLWRAEDKRVTYVVKKGDNLSVIAQRFNVPLSAVLIWNDLNPRKILHPGKQLILYH